MVDYPRPENFVQALKMRRRAVASGKALLVLEGGSDVRALHPFLTDEVAPLAAGGKDSLLRAFRDLEEPLRKGVLFVVDCDGGIEDELKGRPDLVLTCNRDIEADLMFELDAVDRLAHECLAPVADGAADIRRLRDVLVSDAITLSRTLGQIHAAATAQKLPVRIPDPATGRIRRVRLSDISGPLNWCDPQQELLDAAGMLDAVAAVLDWESRGRERVASALQALVESPCKKHLRASCGYCARARYCNGHIMVEALALSLRARHGIDLQPREIDRAIRLGADRGRLKAWGVARRIRSWELNEGRSILLAEV